MFAKRSMHTPHNILPRATQAAGAPSQTTVIIVAAGASVGAVVLALILFYVLRRICWRGKLAPLPPPQPLAHHRERELARFEDRKAPSASRPTTWHDPAYLTASRPFGSSPLTSKVSLLYQESPSCTTPSRHPSVNHSETTEDVSLPLTPMELGLPIANFSLPTPSTSSCSLGSNEIDSLSQALPHTSKSINSSAISYSTSSTQPLNADSHSLSPSSSDVRPRPHPCRRPRPLSMTSATSTTTSWSGHNTIRGVPHGPHSQIQIVLPAPLAPDLWPYVTGEPRVAVERLSMFAQGEGFQRTSVVDNWASTTVRTSRSLSHEDLSTTHFGETRTSMSSQSSRSSSRVLRRGVSPSRSHSHSPSPTPGQNHSPPSAYRPYSPTPPVPRVPSIYNTYTPTKLETSVMLTTVEEKGGGMSGAVSVSTSNESHWRRRSQSLQPSLGVEDG